MSTPEQREAAREVLAALKRRDVAMAAVHGGALADLVLADAAREDAVGDGGPANDIALRAAAEALDAMRAAENEDWWAHCCPNCDGYPCECEVDHAD